MTLTPEQVAEYEERAAKGEKPVLPWLVSSIDDSREVAMVSDERASDDVDVGQVELVLWLPVGIPAKSISFKAYYLAADDALLAFARPLLERPVEGPWRHDGNRVYHKDEPGYLPCEDEIEAEAIARVRNEAWQRRQQDAQKEDSK